MNTRHLLALTLLTLTLAPVAIAKSTTPISGAYLEVRSCDVYTGPCFANAEMGLTGKEGILVWSIDHGSWDGVSIDGLKVIAVVRAEQTLGDVKFQPREGKAVLIVDDKANANQQKALTGFVQAMAGDLVRDVVSVQSVPINAEIGTCSKSGCAKVKAGDLVEVSTRCLGTNDHVCGNEDTFYPPLTDVADASPAYTELAAFNGKALGLTWASTCQRSAFLAAFAK